MMKKKDFEGSDEKKSQLVGECIETIQDKFKDLIYKHDGCRIIQALIKHGSSSQKSHVLNNIKEHMVELMQQKYSKHLAQKAYFYAPTQELKKEIRNQVNQGIGKLIMHNFASDVVEYIYSMTEHEKSRQEMVFAFYGQYFILFKDELDHSDTKQITLKELLDKKPNLRPKILDKIEGIV